MRAVENLLFATPLVTDDLVAFDTDQRRDVAQLPDPLGDFRRDEVAVGEDLEVAVGVFGQDVEQFGVHERFPAHDPEEGIAHFARLVDQPVHASRLDLLLLGRHIDPAALAAQVAAVGDRDVEKRGIELAACQPLLVLADRANAFESGIPSQFPEQALVRLEQHSFGHAEIHH